MSSLDEGLAGLPKQMSEHLVVYLFGPGVGESQVIAFPDKTCIVVDSCLDENQRSYPSRLLDYLDKPKIALLVVTHPHVDHISGMGELVRKHRPERVWRYPGAASLRDLLTRVLSKDPSNTRLVELLRAIKVLDKLQDENVAFEVGWGYRDYEGSEYRISCISPTPHDMERARREVKNLVVRFNEEYRLAPHIQSYLEGDNTHLMDHPNLLSLAVVVEWKNRKILFGGDVEATSPSPHSGWLGILRLLEEDNRLNLVTDVDLVKLPHHGSSNAFEPNAWNRHAKSRKSDCVVSPHAPSGLPDSSVLMSLRRWVKRLGVTSNDEYCKRKIVGAGWKIIKQSSVCREPCIAVIFKESERAKFSIGGSLVTSPTGQSKRRSFMNSTNII